MSFLKARVRNLDKSLQKKLLNRFGASHIHSLYNISNSLGKECKVSQFQAIADGDEIYHYDTRTPQNNPAPPLSVSAEKVLFSVYSLVGPTEKKYNI